MSKSINQKILYSLLLGILLVPTAISYAATNINVAGWIPYWKADAGIADASSHLNSLNTIHPFGYSVQTDGSLKDTAGIDSGSWNQLFKAAKSNNTEVIPTIMWSDAQSIHNVLTNPILRKIHELRIMILILDNNFDGIDIDYEAKLSETKDYFSLFLQELKSLMGDKVLTCAIEARTPPDSLASAGTGPIDYTNDYKEIGKYCDRIEIMAYDQSRVDLKLVNEKRGMPYAPVADIDWDKKVINLAINSGIPKEKIMLGIPTYGYEYGMTAVKEQFIGYNRLWSLSQNYGVDTAKQYGITPSADASGELGFTYFPEESAFKILRALPAPTGTSDADKTADQALLFANATGMNVPFNYVTWSDANAIKEKIDWAKSEGLRGVALFRLDNAEDPKIWDNL
jgi:spore germination protein YaaH